MWNYSSPEHVPYYYYTTNVGQTFHQLSDRDHKAIHGMMMSAETPNEDLLSSIMINYCTACSVYKNVGYTFT